MTSRLIMKGGLVAFVDDDDFERCQRWNWGFSRPHFYVSARGFIGPKHWQLLHRFILRPTEEQIIDHRFGNPLDNRKENIRICTFAENVHNQIVQKRADKTSKFKGVHWTGNGWQAQIKCDWVQTKLGIFESEDEAARAYDSAALEKFKEFALTNKMMGLFDGVDPHKVRRKGIKKHYWTRADREHMHQDWLRLPYKDKINAKGERLLAYRANLRKRGSRGMIYHFPVGMDPSSQAGIDQ